MSIFSVAECTWGRQEYCYLPFDEQVAVLQVPTILILFFDRWISQSGDEVRY